MKRVVAVCFSIPLMLATYALIQTTSHVVNGEFGHNKFDGPILFCFWWILITLWCLVLWMFQRRRARD